MDETVQAIRRALVSVSDKSALAALGAAFSAHGVEIVSTGGTAQALRALGHSVRDVAALTGFPEMLDGRVKTLHPAVHAGLLARRDLAEHREAMAGAGLSEIDAVVVNLYPFEAALAEGADFAACLEQIDIGGPAMLRSAAKNHASVAVASDPADIAALIEEITSTGGGTRAGFRKLLAARAFARTAAYDAAVATWLAAEAGDDPPPRRIIAGEKAAALRYGENPHQRAAFYHQSPPAEGLAAAEQLQGKALSYNNINDTDAALRLLAELDGPGAVIVKHANPCGAAMAPSLTEAYTRAFDCDRVSAFGGIVALNRPLEAETAAAIAEIFTEVVIAPAVSDEARAVFAAKPNLRLLTLGALPDPRAPGLAWRPVTGGLLVQDRDAAGLDETALRVVTERAPSAAEMADMRFAWMVAKHVASNAIVYAKDGATVGIGAGQMSRVDSTRIAARKARDMAEALGLATPLTVGAAVASDAFFPFADGVLTAAEAGATALIQPGGSVRDAEVIAAADAAGLAMVFTGQRHFRH